MPAFTTSRKPCARARTFVKELARIVPDSEVLGRGKQSVDELAESARRAGHEVVAVVTEMHGNPRSIRVLSVSEGGWEWSGELAFKSVKLSREFGKRVKKPLSISTDGKSILLPLLGMEPRESETSVGETGDTITFFQGGEEVGPRMVLRGKK